MRVVYCAHASYAVLSSGIHRGYYMAAQRYEISLRVLKFFFQHEKRNFVSPSDHVIFYLLYKHQWNAKPFYLKSFWSERCGLLWSHSNGDIFTCEDNMLFSHVKMSSFCTKAHLVFHCCLIYNNVKHLMSAGLIFLDMHTRLTLGIVPCSCNFWVCVFKSCDVTIWVMTQFHFTYFYLVVYSCIIDSDKDTIHSHEKPQK